MFGFSRLFGRKGSIAGRVIDRSSILDWEILEKRMLLSAGPSTSPAAGAPAARSALVQQFDVGQGSFTAVQSSAVPAAVQTGLNALAQGTKISSTQQVLVRTTTSGTVYSTILLISGRHSQIAVDSSGKPLVGSIQFSATPLIVQAELRALDAGATIPATQLVKIRGQIGGVTTYSTSIVFDGRTITLVTDSSGKPVQGVMEFSAVPAVVQTALTALDTGGTIPADQLVNVRTRFGGTVVYSSILTIDGEETNVSVDAGGNLLRGAIDFSDAPAAVQTGLQSQDTAGVIPDSQLVRISTERGTTIYSTSVTLGGQATTIAVNSSGNKVTVGGHPFGVGKFLGGGENFGWNESAGASGWFG